MADTNCDESPRSASEGSDQDGLEIFQPLIAAIDFKMLESIATKTRLCRMSPSEREQALHHQISCEVDSNPMIGAYNLVYTITFSDNVRWAARFPGYGLSLTELDRQQMHSDYHTMQLIRSRTSLPIPDVYKFETFSSLVGAPYALMSFVEGSPVSKRWDDQDWITEERKAKILNNLAVHMSELCILQFDKIGSLVFDERGYFTHIGPQLNRELPEGDKIDPEAKEGSTYDDEWGQLSTRGPFHNVRGSLLDSWDDLKGSAEWCKAELAVLRLAVESIPESLTNEDKFYLFPPDFDSQNIFTDDEANITGIIDWDGARTQCAIGSFARYPSWITRDWDPVMYVYGIEGTMPEDSPEQLSTYRQVYATAFAGAMAKPDLSVSHYSADETELSHMFEAIEIAVNSRILRHGIVPKLLDHAFKSKVPFKWRDLLDAYLDGTADHWLGQIKEAFRDMWHPEWNVVHRAKPSCTFNFLQSLKRIAWWLGGIIKRH